MTCEAWHVVAERALGAGVRAGALDEVVHLAAVERLLLVAVVVVFVTGELSAGVGADARRAAVQPLRLVLVGIVGQQVGAVAQLPWQRAACRRQQAVDRGRAARGVESPAVGVGRLGIGAEVVVERLVLLEDHHDVLDRRGGARSALLAAAVVVPTVIL